MFNTKLKKSTSCLHGFGDNVGGGYTAEANRCVVHPRGTNERSCRSLMFSLLDRVEEVQSGQLRVAVRKAMVLHVLLQLLEYARPNIAKADICKRISRAGTKLRLNDVNLLLHPEVCVAVYSCDATLIVLR